MKNAGIPYFPLETVNNDAIEGLLDRFGNKGLGIYIRLLQRIYAINGYYMPYNKSIKLSLARKFSVSYNLVDDIVCYLIASEIFNDKLFKKSNILTSNEIQKSYLNAVKRRKTIELEKDYLLSFAIAYVNKTAENANTNQDNANIIGQSKGNETKQEKIIYRESNTNDSTIDNDESLKKDDNHSLNKFKAEFPEKYVGITKLPSYVDMDSLIKKIKASPWIHDKSNFTLDYMCKEKVYNKIMAGVYLADKQVINYNKKDADKKNAELSYLFDNLNEIET